MKINLTFKSFCNSIRIKSTDAEMKYTFYASICFKYFKLKWFIREELKIFGCWVLGFFVWLVVFIFSSGFFYQFIKKSQLKLSSFEKVLY